MSSDKGDHTRAVSDARRILHCDMDCFYAAVHQRDDPSLRGKPVIIGGNPHGRGVVAAASYEVRRFGVRSAMPCARAVRLCPQAIFIRPEFERYQEESRKVFEIFRRFTEVIQPVSIDEAYLDVTDVYASFGSATELAREVRRQVAFERNLTVSVGVGPNRLVAKIASDFDKPNGLTVVAPSRVEAFLAPMPIRVLQGVGPATEKILTTELGVATIEELRAIPVERLVERLGRFGRTLHDYARGSDERPVTVDRVRKSLSSETTYASDLEVVDRMYEEIDRLAQEVASGLAQRGLRGSTVVAKVRYHDFTTVTRSKTLERPIDDAQALASIGRQLLDRTEARERPVRLLGLGVSNFASDPDQDPQLRLSFDWP